MSSVQPALSYHAASVYAEDIATLNEYEWLNDNILTLWIEYITHELLEKANQDFVSSSSSSSSFSLASQILIMHPSAVQLSLLLSPIDYQEAMENLHIPNYNVIICPINNSTNPYEIQSGSHWSLLVILHIHHHQQENNNKKDDEYIFIGIDSMVSLPVSSSSSSSLWSPITISANTSSLQLYTLKNHTSYANNGNIQATLRFIKYMETILGIPSTNNGTSFSSNNNSTTSLSGVYISSSFRNVFGYLPCLIQENSYDCGIHTLYTIERLCQQICSQISRLSKIYLNNNSINLEDWLSSLQLDTLFLSSSSKANNVTPLQEIYRYRKRIQQWIKEEQQKKYL